MLPRWQHTGPSHGALMAIGPLHQDGTAREDFVLTSLVSWLRDRGLSTVLLERPDRLLPNSRTFTKVTSDALLSITPHTSASQLWACDAMVMAAPFIQVQVLQALHDGLDNIATTRSINIQVEGSFAPIDEPEDKHPC